ncbi:MAG: hypothetical protein IIB12_06865, partial [Chloroflexi bacterium]|nr:hypothetical protein [Chloroflexota bacterium]
MLDGIRQRLYRDQRGITGLSAGIFSAEKGKEALYAGLEGARSSMSITDGGDDLDQLIFVVTNALTGEASDFNE